MGYFIIEKLRGMEFLNEGQTCRGISRCPIAPPCRFVPPFF